MTSIVLTVCKQHKIAPDLFFGSLRGKKLTECRAAAIQALLAAGFSQRGTARMIRRDASTVRYWIHEARRNAKRAYMRQYHAARAQ